jgi:alpha-galactosidase
MWIIFLAIMASTDPSAQRATSSGAAGQPREAEMATGWNRALIGQSGAEDALTPSRLLPTEVALPFSFTYGTQKSGQVLPTWRRTDNSRKLDDTCAERVVVWSDAKTGLEVRLETISYRDFPAVEWVLYFKNNGSADTPVLEDILPLDARLTAAGARPPILHYARGALCCIDDFAPLAKTMDPGTRVRLQPGGGRSSSEFLPFFNIDAGSEGLIVAIGWSGEWAAEFERDRQDSLRVKAGMARTHLTLHPGEEIRTPRILTLCWQGERMRGNNLLRRFLLAHRRPHPGGKPIVLPVLIGAWGGASAAEHLKTIHRIVSRDLPIGLYWIDAEWFGRPPWFKFTGDWQLRKDLYPEGFKAISEPLHRSGRRFLLWIEPHRVCQGTPWHQFKDRPNWLLGLKDGKPEYKQRNLNWKIPHDDPRWVIWESRRSQITEGDLLWNMGEPAARRFLTDWISDRIDEFGLDWYREDFNIAPLEYWQAADAPDRIGMTEVRFIEGLYAMWDELLQRHPHLAIDNCASGGRRMDIESIGRSTALWRTDWPADAIHRQCHTLGLLSWVPLQMTDGAVIKKGNEYEIRSSMTAGLNVKLDGPDDETSAAQARTLIEQYLGIQRYYYGDYYPLTEYSQAGDAWVAYQLNLPEAREGLVVALKRPASPQASRVFRLHDLNPDLAYEVKNVDTGEVQTIAGARLMGDGLEVRLSNKPDSVVILYKTGDRHK